MPELPEVDFCRRALLRWSAGQRIVAVDVLDPRVVRDSRTDRPSAGSDAARTRLPAITSGASLGIDRHGKRLLWRFDAGSLLLHLGMTGRWTRGASSFPKVRFTLDGGDRITFHDPRLLGGIVPFSTIEEGQRALSEGLGPDALVDPLPPLPGKRAIKLVLMDQAVVAGLGNVQAMEALWRAGIHPLRAASTLTPVEHARLQGAVAEQLAATIRLLGDGDEIVYVEEPGAPNPFPLYQRDGEPCPRCRTPIATFRQAGRGTWWCPACQRG